MSSMLYFRLSTTAPMQELVVALSSIFHVVPCEVADSEGLVLSVEVAADHPALVPEVREVVSAADPGAHELYRVDAGA